MYSDYSRKSKKKSSEFDLDFKTLDEPESQVVEDEKVGILSINEPDDWSDTPLSALKNESTDHDLKSSIDVTIQAVSESEYKFDEPASTDKDDDSVSNAAETSASVKTEKSSDVAVEDDNSSSVKSAQTTPQSSKTKRRSKTPRSKNSRYYSYYFITISFDSSL